MSGPFLVPCPFWGGEGFPGARSIPRGRVYPVWWGIWRIGYPGGRVSKGQRILEVEATLAVGTHPTGMLSCYFDF